MTRGRSLSPPPSPKPSPPGALRPITGVGAGALVLATWLLVVYLHGMEWLFFATKPSFMSRMDAASCAGLMLETPWVTLLGALVALAPLLALARLLASRRGGGALALGARLVPGAALAATLFLMLENFTYTVLGFGVKSATGSFKLAYLSLLLGLLVVGVRGTLALEQALARRRNARLVGALAAAWVLASVGAWMAGDMAAGTPRLGGAGAAGQESEEARRRPDILLIGADGLRAEHLSMFGSTRDTTPELAAWLEEQPERLLVAENAFANASTTGASLMSMLTGRLPTRTGMIYAPDVLTGEDRYRHLPGLLRRAGYRNLAVSIRHYADPFDFQMYEGFHVSNDLRPEVALPTWGPLESLSVDARVFWLRSWERLANRVEYLLGWRDAVDSFFEVTGAREYNVNDVERVEQVLGFFRDNPGPVFAHVHLLQTHGPRFFPVNRRFSEGKEQTEDWDPDFLADAIGDFDWLFARLRKGLKELGRLEDALVIVYSDHGPGWTSTTRLPLVMVLPPGRRGRRVVPNVQNLDVAPTILELLGLPRPEWIHGHSLVAGDPEPCRDIFSAQTFETERGTHGVVARAPGPPWFTMDRFALVRGATRARLELATATLRGGAVPGHTSPPECVDDAPTLARRMAGHLAETGYDVSALGKLKPGPPLDE